MEKQLILAAMQANAQALIEKAKQTQDGDLLALGHIIELTLIAIEKGDIDTMTGFLGAFVSFMSLQEKSQNPEPNPKEAGVSLRDILRDSGIGTSLN